MAKRDNASIPSQIDDDRNIEILCDALENHAFKDIQFLTGGPAVLASFMVCCCFIEQMSTYRYGTKNVGRPEFESFVKEYLAKYDPELLRKDLRNQLVHNYALGHKYALTGNVPHLHLEGISGGKQVINLENFVQDLREALNVFINQLRNDPVVKANALKVMAQINLITKNAFAIKVKG